MRSRFVALLLVALSGCCFDWASPSPVVRVVDAGVTPSARIAAQIKDLEEGQKRIDALLDAGVK